MVFNGLKQPDHLARGGAFQLDVILGNHANLRVGNFHLCVLDRVQHTFIRGCISGDRPTIPVVIHILPPFSSTIFIKSSSLAPDLGTTISPFLWNIHETEPASPRFPPPLVKMWRISLTVRLRLSVVTSTSNATPPGP